MMIKKSLRGEDNTNTFWRHIKCGGNEKRKKRGIHKPRIWYMNNDVKVEMNVFIGIGT